MRFEAASNEALSEITEKLIEKLGDRLKLEIIQQLREQSPSFTSLDLSSKQLDDEDVSFLAEFLKFNTTVRKLQLDYNKIGASGAAHLARALEINATLTTLSLEGNDIEDAGAECLAQMLEANTTLAVLSLGNTKISDQGVGRLAQMLRTNTSLRELDLGGNEEISSSGSVHLAQALEINSALTTLNLWGSNIGDLGAKSWAQALGINRTLRTLEFAGNIIGDQGAVCLAQALTINTTLLTLNLERNRIGDLGTKHLAQALEINTTLMGLSLSGNSHRYKEWIDKKLERNKRLALRFYYQGCMLLRLGGLDGGSTLAMLGSDVINVIYFWITLPFQKTEASKLYCLPNIKPLRSQALLNSLFLPPFPVQIKNKIQVQFSMSILSVNCIPHEGISLSLTTNSLSFAATNFVKNMRVLSSKITSNKQTDELILLISDRSMLQSFLTDLGFSEKQSTEFFEDYRIKELVPEIPKENCLIV